MKQFGLISLLVALTAFATTPVAAQAKGGFGLGISTDYTQGVLDGNVGIGVLGDYTAAVGTNMFAGVRTGWRRSLNLNGYKTSTVDALVRVGVQTGQLAPYVAGGFSRTAINGGSISVISTGTGGFTSGSVVTTTVIGGSGVSWKFAGGVDILVNDHMFGFLQLEYSNNESTTVRLGYVYRF